MDSKTIIAVVLIMGIWIFYFGKSPNREPKKVAQQEQSQAVAANKNTSEAPKLPPNEASSESAKLREQVYDLENSKIKIRLNGLGEIQSFVLPGYLSEVGSESNVEGHFENFGAFNQQLLSIEGKAVDWSLDSVSETEIRLKSKSGVRRVIQLVEDNYELKIVDEFENTGNKTQDLHLSLRLLKPFNKSKELNFFENLFKFFAPPNDLQEAVWLNQGDLESEPLDQLSERPKDVDEAEAVAWAGFATKYFFTGVVPVNASISGFQSSRQGREAAIQKIELTSKQTEPGATASFEYNFYLGPKKLDALTKAGGELNKAVAYGDWIGPISRALLATLLFFFDIIPNYGVGIILLTILVKLILFPLAYKSAVSMRKLAAVQPKLQEIREKYKKDAQRMQAETMALWKQEKVNPIGGCLPILLQFPIFIALYRVFFVSFEMRQAPFIFWINDLSIKDPFFVLPILVTLSMWMSQKLMPMPQTGGADTEAAKIQRQMMKILPFFFGLISLFFPAGLTLYFFINGLLTILQQYFLNKRLDKLFPRPQVVQKSTANG